MSDEVQKSVGVIRELLRVYGVRQAKLSRTEQELRERSMQAVTAILGKAGRKPPQTDDLADDALFELRLVAIEIARYPRKLRDKMVEALPAEVRREISLRMFTFADILRLDDIGLQLLLRSVESRIVAISMLDADRKIVDRIFRNLSSRATEMIRQEMEYARGKEDTDIDAARNEVAGKLRDLVSDAKIAIR